MEIASLGSGSRGNGTLVRHGDTCLLIDCGFRYSEAVKRLSLRGIDPETLSAVFITHEHSDHASGVKALAERHQIPVYATRGTWIEIGGRTSSEHHELTGSVQVQALQVQPVTVPHDARQPVQFVIESPTHRFGLLSDLGSLSKTVIERFQQLDGLSLEFNHDVDMLAEGPYPQFLKQRVGGDFGHLSNAQAATLLQHIASSRLQTVVACHLSEQNNAEALVEDALEHALDHLPAERMIATQAFGFDWMTLG